MNESKLEEKKQLGFTKEILDYLKKNPSVAIAVGITPAYAGKSVYRVVACILW